MLTDDIVHFPVLLRVTNTKIAAEHIAQEDEILLPKRLVESVACLKVSSNGFSGRTFC